MSTKGEDHRFMSAHELAQLLRISVRSVYRYFNEGQLCAYRIGGVLRFEREHVEKFIQSCKAGA
jgi:excisionase family DNA binding protein